MDYRIAIMNEDIWKFVYESMRRRTKKIYKSCFVACEVHVDAVMKTTEKSANKHKLYGLKLLYFHLEIYTETISRLRLGDYKLSPQAR